MSASGRYPVSFYLALAANLFFFTGFQWTFATLPGYIQEIGGELGQEILVSILAKQCAIYAVGLVVK